MLGQEATVEILLKNGANIHEKNNHGKNIIYLDIFIYQSTYFSDYIFTYLLSIHLSIYVTNACILGDSLCVYLKICAKRKSLLEVGPSFLLSLFYTLIKTFKSDKYIS